jgi:Phosphoenolpyruvate carboxykinase
MQPCRFTDMLANRTLKHQVDCWLISTAWTSGRYSMGKRCSLAVMRRIVNAVHSEKHVRRREIYTPVEGKRVQVVRRLAELRYLIFSPTSVGPFLVTTALNRRRKKKGRQKRTPSQVFQYGS